MNIIRNDSQLLISFDPAFVILEDKSAGIEYPYVFYNSIRHIGCRINKLELFLLNLLYKYREIDYILSKFSEDKQELIKGSLDFISQNSLLSTKELEFEPEKALYPSVYYIHLTYRCNLKCSYCYNKNARKGRYEEFEYSEWCKMIDKIKPHAKNVTLTGGEFLLYHDIERIVKYIRLEIPNVELSCISNCMHDFSSPTVRTVLSCIDKIMLSCDSVNNVGERVGFKPELFKKNVQYVKREFPHIKVSVSSTATSGKGRCLNENMQFCNAHDCDYANILMVPHEVGEIDLMPSITEQLEHERILYADKDMTISELPQIRRSCGAGSSVCSIDPFGNVYPCQSLMYESCLMGNLLEKDIDDLDFVNTERRMLPMVDDIPSCRKCSVKYLCGGGCLATGYTLNGNVFDRNRLTCPACYHHAMSSLRNLNNRIPYNQKES